MALQLTAIDLEDGIGLHFTKVLDTMKLGDDEPPEVADRKYWENKRGNPETVKLADSILVIIREFAPNAELSYNKYYIGLTVDGKTFNFAIIRAYKKDIRLEISIPEEDEIDEILDSADIDVLGYDKRRGRYRIKLRSEDIKKHKNIIKDLLQKAFDRRM
jgi:hypothetical protein